MNEKISLGWQSAAPETDPIIDVEVSSSAGDPYADYPKDPNGANFRGDWTGYGYDEPPVLP